MPLDFPSPNDEGQLLSLLSERDKESFGDGIPLCLHICGLRGIQGTAAQQDSFFARSLVGAKYDPLDLLDPVRTKKAQLLPGLRIGQETDCVGWPVKPADEVAPTDERLRLHFDEAFGLVRVPIGVMIDNRAINPLFYPFLWERMDDTGDHLPSKARAVCWTQKLRGLWTQALESFLPDLQTKAVSA